MANDASDVPPAGTDEPDNPYAPPSAALAPARGPDSFPAAGEAFSPNLVIYRAWEIYKENFGLVFWLVILPILIGFLYQAIGQSMSESVDQTSTMGMVAKGIFLAVGLVLDAWLRSGTILG